jgi:hypothetical protein
MELLFQFHAGIFDASLVRLSILVNDIAFSTHAGSYFQRLSKPSVCREQL